MENPFKKPVSVVETLKNKIAFTLVFGLFIFLFLFLFKPFGMVQLEPVKQFWVSLGFGLVTIFMLFIFKFLIEPVVIRRNWTFGKSILWDLVVATTIGVANYFYVSLLFPQIFIFKYFFFAIWSAILVGIIPVTISYIISFNRLYRSALKKASISPSQVTWTDEVRITGGNPRNDSKFNPRNIAYICSNDNYVTVFTINGDTLSKTHLRGTLKATETELRKNNSFFRCHKCYIVNTEYADRLSGNIQNLKIRLKFHGLEIPVSRSKAAITLKKFRPSVANM